MWTGCANWSRSQNETLVICCGGLRTDYVITAQGDVRLMEMGGNALYAAAGAKAWLDDVAILSRIGDGYPLGWLDDLRDYGFDTRGIRKVPGPQDHRTFYAYLDNDTRVDTDPAAHFRRVGAELPEALRDYVHSTPGQDDPHHYEPLAVTPEDLASFFEQRHAPGVLRFTDGASAKRKTQIVTGLHIAPISIRTQRYLPEAARKQGVQIVSADPGERAMQPALLPYIEDMLGYIDVFMPSDQEVESLFCDEPAEMDARQCAEWFAARGPSIVVIKLGSEGALVHERNSGQFWHVPALPVRALDVTGAGDAFCGGFMAELVKHGDPVRAAITGTVSASLTIQDYGALHVLAASEDEKDHRASLLRSYVAAV
jgi:ribokinase